VEGQVMARRLQPYLPSCSRPEQVATGSLTARRTATLLSCLSSTASQGPRLVVNPWPARLTSGRKQTLHHYLSMEVAV